MKWLKNNWMIPVIIVIVIFIIYAVIIKTHNPPIKFPWE